MAEIEEFDFDSSSVPSTGQGPHKNEDISKHLLSLSSILSTLKADVEGLHAGVSGLRSDVATQIDELRKDVSSVAQGQQQFALSANNNAADSQLTGGLVRRKSTSINPQGTPVRKVDSEMWDDDNGSQGEFGEEDLSEDMDALVFGDIISIYLSDHGPVFGDLRLKNLGVEHLEVGKSRISGPTTNDAAFRIVPKLNYRTKQEASARVIDSKASKMLEKRRLERLANEKEQNNILLEKVKHNPSAMPVVKYGDIIQLQHVRSGNFVGMRKGHSLANENNQTVLLMDEAEEGRGCYFKVLPRFKVRAIGSSMFTGDEVIFESVLFENVVLSASPAYWYPQAKRVDNLQVPLLLRSPKRLEVNGCFNSVKMDSGGGGSNADDDITTFKVQLFARFTETDGAFLTNFSQFRLFHMDFLGFLSASCNLDKGATLDALDNSEHLKLRSGSIAPHIPYLRTLKVQEPNHPSNMNAKSVWSFEAIDPFKSGVIGFNTPLRIKHVVTNKYLCVDSAFTATRVKGGSGVKSELPPLTPSADNGSKFYNCYLVSGDNPKAWKKMKDPNITQQAIVFRILPTGSEGAKVRGGTSTIRIEHRTNDGRRLYLKLVEDKKPKFIDDEFAAPDVTNGALNLSRVGFVEKSTGVEVFSLKPLIPSECNNLNKISSYIPVIKLYTHRILEAKTPDEFPFDMVEQLVGVMLDLIDDLCKGKAPKRRFEYVCDYCTEAHSLDESSFARLFAGETSETIQHMCVETKLLDALFEAIVAPYNHFNFMQPPFESKLCSELIPVQMYFYACIQRILVNNQDAMEYFSSQNIRTWHSPRERGQEAWRNLLVDQCEDGYGAAVLLGLLFKSSRRILTRIVDDDLLERFRSLIMKCGPDPRLINLFASTCWVEGKPVQLFQEACVRKLWMIEANRYTVAATFHESTVDVLKKQLQSPYFYPYKSIKQLDGTEHANHPRMYPINGVTPDHFIGKTEANNWNPIVVVWRSDPNEQWGDNKGGDSLYWSPKDLGIPSIGPHHMSDGQYIGEYVPIEHLMWTLEPGRLSQAVTGKMFEPFNGLDTSIKESSSGLGSNTTANVKSAKAERKLRSEMFTARVKQEELFQRIKGLAVYITDQIRLLTETCLGRSINSINTLEKSFSYEMLMNMATNPWLPYRFRAAAVKFSLSLYVDRFPQLPKCGAPHLPEQLWMYSDPEKADFFDRKSTIPIIEHDLEIHHNTALPVFSVPSLSSAYGRSNPLVSMPYNTKFYILNNLCVRNLGADDGLTYKLHGDSEGKNVFLAALLQAQHFLLQFGFQSRIEKLKRICERGAVILDGRDDNEAPDTMFNPPENRFKDMGSYSDAIIGIKMAVVNELFDICDLQVNYRVALLFGKFKARMRDAADIGSWAGSFEMFLEFEGLFTSQCDEKYLTDSVQMSLAEICDKPDFEDSLVDALMYEDNKLMAASLHLLERVFSQRRRVVEAVNKSIVLPHPKLAVYGEIHALRADINELFELVNTHSVWGVHSVLSGPFDQDKFGKLMNIVNTLLTFLYTEKLVEDREFVPPSNSDAKPLSSFDTNGGKSKKASSVAPLPLTKGGVAVAPILKKVSSTFAMPGVCRSHNILVNVIVKALDRAMPNDDVDIRAAKLFEQLDVNKNGSLSSDEFSRGLRDVLDLDEEAMNREEVEVLYRAAREIEVDKISLSGFRNFIGGGGNNSNYEGSFTDLEIGVSGNVYSADRIWSTDVASEWIDRIQGKGESGRPLWPCKYHQEILRASNLQDVLCAALDIEYDIAITGGSKCTVGLKVESARRLALAKTALLVLIKAFVTGDPENQEIMFKELKLIQRLATPPELVKDEGSGKGSAAHLIRPDHYKCYTSPQTQLAKDAPPHTVESRWPSNIREMSQDLLIAIFRGNEKLCVMIEEQTELLDMMAFVANQACSDPLSSVDKSPALDFFFNLCQPTTQRTLFQFQLYTARMLMSHFDGMRKKVGSCIARVSEELAKSSFFVNRRPQKENPYRLVRLVRAVVASGNDRTAIFVSNAAQEMDFSVLCRAILAHIVVPSESTDKSCSPVQLLEIFSPREDVQRVTENSESSSDEDKFTVAKPFDFTVSRENYELGGLDAGSGFDLLLLLADFSLLLPLSEREVRAEAVWTIMKELAVPVIDWAASVNRPLSPNERAVNAALVDFFNHILAKLDGHGLLEALLADQYRSGDNIIEDMRDDLRFMKDSPTYESSISGKTRDAIENIILLCDGSSDLIDTTKPIKDVHLYSDQMISNSVVKQELSPSAGPVQVFHHRVNEFRSALTHNKYINLVIQLRRYKMLSKLEQGVKADKRKYRGPIDVTWESLVKRMAVYARDRCGDLNAVDDENSNDGLKTCKIIFRLLRDYLVRTRSYPLDEEGHRLLDEDGKNNFDDPAVVSLKVMQPDQLSDEERQVYYQKQMNLLENGAVHLLLDVIMMRNIDEEMGGVADICFDVLDEIQLGGNNAVREVIYDYMVNKDVDGRVLKIISFRIERSTRELSDAKSMGILGAKGEFMNSNVSATLKDAAQIVQLLVNFCVDHYSNFQHLLREQPMLSEFTYDLIGMCAKLLCDLVESQTVVEMFSTEEVQLVRILLQFFIVCMLGPCPENQIKLAKSDVSIALNSIIAAKSETEQELYDADPAFVNMQALSFKVLSACLEARKDNECHRALKGHVDIKLLCESAVSIDTEIRSMMAFASSRNRLLDAVESERVRVKLDALAQIWFVHHEFFPEMTQRLSVLQASKIRMSYASLQNNNAKALTASPDAVQAIEAEAVDEVEGDIELKEEGDEVEVEERSLVVREVEESKEDNGEEEDEEDIEEVEEENGALQTFQAPLIGVTEIQWKGRVFRTCFPLPLASKYLTKKTKAAFLIKSRLLNNEKRLSSMFGSVDIFVSEMEWVQTLSERFKLYRFMNKHFATVKSVIYANNMLLNLNVLMSPPEVDRPYYKYFHDYGSLSNSHLQSLRVTYVLGVINLIFFLAVTIYLGVTTLPIVIKEIDNKTEKSKKTMAPQDFTSKIAFNWWIVTLIFNVMFIYMHSANFPQHRNENSTMMYAYIIFGLNLPWTLSCLRRYIVVPDSHPKRVFVIIYDSLVNMAFLRDQLILQILCVLGFMNTNFFTLMLFDIININTKLANIVKALAFHAESLFFVFYLLVSTALCYASFGLQYFPEAFQVNYQGAAVQFKTVLSCFWFLFHNFVTRGNLKATLAAPEPKGDNWLPRIAFDSAFFIWVGIILFTSITALLVDALGKARVDAAARANEERNVCFMCGMTRTTYDDLGLKAGSRSFDAHCTEDHDPWTYVAYVTYLRNKQSSQLSGIETYAKREMIKNGPWVPSKTCHLAQFQGKGKVVEEVKEEFDFNNLLLKLSNVESKVEEVVVHQKEQKKSKK